MLHFGRCARARRRLWLGLLVGTLPGGAAAEPVVLRAVQGGHVDYAFVGNTMTDNSGLSSGTNCLLPANTVEVTAAMLSPRARLRQAVLYVSGSLLDDGIDYRDPDRSIYAPAPGLDDSTAAGQDGLDAAARAAAPRSVQLTLPGAAAPLTVAADSSYVSSYTLRGSTPEAGNVAFFTTPIDITAAVQAAGTPLAGVYRVAGLLADVCLGLEAVCPTQRCQDVSAVHSNGNASFALLLVYEDLALAPRTVTTFAGMQILANAQATLVLPGAMPISNPASGSLTFYALEGDLDIAGGGSGGPCGADEFMQVSAAPGRAVCLVDADNPANNLFNGSINQLPPVPGQPGPPACAGPHACGLAGVDIDRFDVSQGLAAGATAVTVQVGTGSDRIGLGALVFGVDVFAPELALDSQFRLPGAPLAGQAQLGAPLVYSLAVSNTGNLPAQNVTVVYAGPAQGGPPTLLRVPGGAAVATAAGQVTVGGFAVAAGTVAELRVALQPPCEQLDQVLTASATVAADGVAPFTVAAPDLRLGGPGTGPCAGLDPDGPFAALDPPRVLRGGGCRAAPLGDAAAALAIALAARRGRRRRGHGTRAAAVLLCLGASGCGRHRASPPPPGPAPLRAGEALPGSACEGDAAMVRAALPDGRAFCIDRFEAGLPAAGRGNAVQGPDAATDGDGSTAAAATVGLAQAPAVSLSWWQAQAACTNAHKRLCTVAEWERACRGVGLLLYPYGDDVDEAACNGFAQDAAQRPAVSGSYRRCVSPLGAYDLSGNVEEWLADAVPRLPAGTDAADRALHGGSFIANAIGLACVDAAAHDAPGTALPSRGFRCCRDAAP